VTLNAGEQVDADPNCKLAPKRSITPDRLDPFQLAAQCGSAVSRGTTSGTAETTVGNNISTGQTAEVDYRSPGGTVSFALCYPGSFMTLSVFDPAGVEHASRNVVLPVTGNLSGPPGLYRAVVHAVNVPGGEAFAVSFATNVMCAPGSFDTGSVVRKTLSSDDLQASMAQSGVTGITIKVVGTSSSSARLYYYSNLGGTEISWTIDFYAATPNLGAVVTQITVRGINITTQVVSRLTSAGASISSIPQDYTVDRVYSCAASGGLLVIEGHRS